MRSPKELFEHIWTGGYFPSTILLESQDEALCNDSALSLLEMLVCETPEGCGSCPSCRMLLAHKHPNVLVVDPDADQIKLDDAKKLQSFVDLAPSPSFPAFRGPMRLIWIKNAERMNAQTSNRLLKTLEEPPPSVRIILSTTEPQKLLRTILSRAVRLPLDVFFRPRTSKAEASETTDLQKDLRELFAASFGEAPLSTAQTATAWKSVEELLNKHETKGPHLIVEVELAWNYLYRRIWESPESRVMLPPRLNRERRHALSEWRRLADKQKIAINTRLGMESLL